MMIEVARHWALRPPVPEAVAARYADLSPVIVQLLYNRGIVEPAEVESFLAVSPPSPADPWLMKGMATAVTRLARAAASGEKVAIYGDFDADGVTASALLSEAFATFGIAAIPYIPTRAEGYGLNVAALRGLADQGVRLVVTVDCGVNSVAEVCFANDMGLDVIITDHHRIDGALPPAVAVINPRQPDCAYPFKDLAAVGIAFQLVQALRATLPLADGATPRTVADGLLDLVALGTVADVAALLGENRALVRSGLEALNCTTRPGLRALISSAGLRLGALSAGNIGFALGPRLNAAGRVQDARTAYELLLERSDDRAMSLAAALESANRQRQNMLSVALDQARDEVQAHDTLPKILLVAGAGFPAGIVGLVAGRLAEQFHRPAFVAELADDECRGSARSIDGFNVAEALASCRTLLTRFGGHAQAAGFSVPTANLSALHQRLLTLAEEQLDDSALRPRLLVDAELPLSDLSHSLYAQLMRLAPFGSGNPTPLFLTSRLRVVSKRRVGGDLPGHLKLDLHDGVRHWSAIAFRMGHLVAQVATYIDIVYTVVLNEWDGRQSLELHIRDWRPSS